MKLPHLNLDFLKNNRQIFLSAGVIILVPVLVVFNTYILLTESNKVVDKSLQTRAVTIAQAFNAAVLENLGDKTKIEAKADEFLKFSDYTKRITLYEKSGDGFLVFFSTSDRVRRSEAATGEELKLFALSWYGNEPYAKLTKADAQETVSEGKEIKNGEILWATYTPIKNAAGKNTYIAKVEVSTNDVESFYADLYRRSILITIGIVLVIVVMIFANGQLFQYSILFQKLKEVDQMKDDFISIASHELRTPLTTIKGYLSMLIEDISDKKMSAIQKKEIMEQAIQSTDRLNELVADILDVSRIEQQRMKFEPQKTDLIAIVKSVTGELSVGAKQKGLKLVENYSEQKMYSNLDEAKFKQVLINLIGNAIKYTEKGEVEIIVESTEKENEIKIKDSGIGMDEEERQKLFSKFYRVRNERTEKIVGTGLGLWITKEIVEAMGGHILVDSIKDVGSEFTVILPKA